jgi:tetratricopeptide (TPR) repeat protein
MRSLLAKGHLVACIFFITFPSFAGDKPSPFAITAGDEQNIKARAQKAVERFMNLLNTIATGLDLEIPETETIIRRSYLPEDSRIFYDSNVVVVDDLRKVESVALAKEKAAYSYLRDFEIFYRKSENASVVFSNFDVSNVKKADYLYIKVNYDCLFNNKSKISEDAFTTQKRVAELRVEKINNKWKAWITDVHFFDSSDIADVHKNDIVLADDPAGNTDTATAETDANDFMAPVGRTNLNIEDREVLRRKNDSIRTYMAFRNVVDSGKHHLNMGQYIIAYQFFNEAETVSSGSAGVIRQGDIDFLQTMIAETRKNISASHRTPEQIYAGYMQDAMIHRNQRSYDKAIDDYNLALQQKPGDEVAAQKKKSLTDILNNLAQMEAKYNAGKYREAISDYDKAIKANPDNADYYLGRGLCFEKTREPKKAMADYEKAAGYDQNYLQAYKSKGNLYQSQGRYAEAIASYTIAVSLDRNDVVSYLKLAELNKAINNPMAALSGIDKGLASNGTNALLNEKKAEILMELGQPAKAIGFFTTSVELDSANADAWFQRALCYLQLRQVAPAAADFDKAKMLGVDNAKRSAIAEVYYKDALKSSQQGYTASAIGAMSDAILLDPSVAGYRFKRGQYFLATGKYDAAIADFSEAILLDPNDESIVQARGLAYYFKSDYGSAISDFKQVIRLDAKSSDTYKYLGDAFLRIKDYASAIANYEGSLSAGRSGKHTLRDSLRASLYNGLGQANYALGKYAVAKAGFDHAIDANRNFPDSWYNRSGTYLRLNKPAEAEADINKALKLGPGNELYKSRLAEIYAHQKKYDQALTQLNEAIPKKTNDSIWLKPIYLRAKCYVEVKNYSAAFRDFKTIQSSGLQENFEDLDTDLGFVYLAFNQPDTALACFEKDNRNTSDAMSMYGTALVYARKVQWDQAFNFLEKALATKKIARAFVSQDTRIDALRGDKRYKRMMKKYY